jgi:hypothetical protein
MSRIWRALRHFFLQLPDHGFRGDHFPHDDPLLSLSSYPPHAEPWGLTFSEEDD